MIECISMALSGRKWISVGLLCPLWLQEPTQPEPPKLDPAVETFRREEFEELERMNKDLAERHFKLAKWCEKTKLMHRARYHYLRAISYHPDHENARKVLGFKRSGSSWAAPKEASFFVDVDDRIAPPEREADITADWKSFQTQYQPILQFRAERDLKLADKAKAANLPAEELRILNRIMEYWPDCVDARNRLKFVRETRDVLPSIESTGRAFWLTSEQKKLLEQVKVKGPLKEKTDEEQAIKTPFLSYQTDRFRISAGIPEDFARVYVRNAEAGYRYILSLNPEIKVPETASKERIRLYAFIGESEYRSALESIVRVGPNQLTQLLRQRTYRDPIRAFIRHVDLADKSTHSDWFFHTGAEYAMSLIFPRITPWFQEALSYMVTYDLNDTCHTTCISFEKGSQVEMVDQWRQPNAWRDLLVESILMQEDPPVKMIFEANFRKLESKGGVKAWSLLQFLRQLDQSKFLRLLQEVATGSEVNSLIGKIYGLSDKQLDVEWHEWALKTY